METKQDLLIRRPLLFPPSKEVLSVAAAGTSFKFTQ